MRVLKQIIIGIITVIAFIFAAQNFDTVQIVFLRWSVQLPIAVVVFAIYILGVFSGGLIRSLFQRVKDMDQPKNKEVKESGFFSDGEER